MSTTAAGAFGTKVEEYMARLGMQQNELAKKVGLSPSHLSRIVNGTRKPPRVGKVRRMIKALRLTEDEADDFCDRAGLSLLILQKNSSKEKEGMKGDIRSKNAGGKEPGGAQPPLGQPTQKASSASTLLRSPLTSSRQKTVMHRLAVLKKMLHDANEEVREIEALAADMYNEE
jgi:transcriptional regulator with XRE-family HTH domain